MALILDTRQLPPSDRADAVREIIADTVVPVDIDFPAEQGPASVYGAIVPFGDLTLCSVYSNATTVERTPALARDATTPSIFLALQMEGSSIVVQNGRETALNPGDLVFSESTSPYTLVDGDGVRQHFFCVPASALALPQDTLRSLSATHLSPGHPVTHLAATYLRRLAGRPEAFTASAAEAVGPPSIELIRAVLTTHLDAAVLADDSLHATLTLRILEYLRRHLADPGLNAEQVAAAHHISVRHLYNVLARDGISFGDWLRNRRLEQCRKELSRPGRSQMTIASIARRWGFLDASSFGRLFRMKYGCSPRDWRELHTRR